MPRSLSTRRTFSRRRARFPASGPRHGAQVWYIPTILAAYKPRSASTFRISGHVVTYPCRISLPLSAKLVVHSRGTGAVICVTYVRRLKSR